MGSSIQYPARVEPLVPSLLEFDSTARWFQPQQAPVAHRRFRHIAMTAEGAEPTLLEEVSRVVWVQPQHPPVPHRWFRPASGASSGIDATLLEGESQTLWFQPQQPPVPHKFYRPASFSVGEQAPGLLDEFSQNVAWVQPQQLPVPHEWFRPASGSVGGIDPSLLEEVSQVHWFQPQSLPLPIAKRSVYLDQYVRAPDETEFFTFDVSAGFPYLGQQAPVPHRGYDGAVTTTLTGPDESTFGLPDTSWYQPQQHPVAHRLYSSAATGMTFVIVVEAAGYTVPFVPRDPKLEPPLRRFVDVMAEMANSLFRQRIIVKTGQTEWEITKARSNRLDGPPTASHDAAHGYGIGEVWVDTVTNEAYIAVDVTNGAAIWRQIT